MTPAPRVVRTPQSLERGVAAGAEGLRALGEQLGALAAHVAEQPAALDELRTSIR